MPDNKNRVSGQNDPAPKSEDKGSHQKTQNADEAKYNRQNQTRDDDSRSANTGAKSGSKKGPNNV